MGVSFIPVRAHDFRFVLSLITRGSIDKENLLKISRFYPTISRLKNCGLFYYKIKDSRNVKKSFRE